MGSLPLWNNSNGQIDALAPAKLNLFLHITGKRADGYHLLESLFVFTALGDRLTITSTPSKNDITLTITGPYAKDLEGFDVEDNLVMRAARSLLPHASAPVPVAITLEKNLPIASGLGGGSSDAATALQLLRSLWGVDPSKLPPIALTLGADVPSCLDPVPCLVHGIGEQINPLVPFPSLPVVLVNPNIPLTAKAVYSAYAPPFSAPLNSIGNDPIAFLQAQQNDLQAPAITLVPAIKTVLDALGTTAGCKLSRMSGSGATCFGIFDTFATAQEAVRLLQQAHPDWWVQATETVSSN
ncbi:MAG: 4-diphosphocytidyl-2-C-methyl-D-erythritol kinase [Rickettsiales bacterium]|jgi:4-diphosphocytidyl-2-C-methyl-D-erythritol kinase|nr:4-diphosphocytidyl-2-C-methyl-D-erythritol kinase [Rickettsiales bacterium]